MSFCWKSAVPLTLLFLLSVFGAYAKTEVQSGEHPTNAEAKRKRTFEITHVQFSGATFRSTVTIDPLAEGSQLTPKELALDATTWFHGLGSSTNRVVSYAEPDSLDGAPATTNAVLSEIPRPHFWRTESFESLMRLKCNVTVRIVLNSNGTTSAIERVPGEDSCPYLSDVVDAANGIKFKPATLDGVPIAQKISILYRLN